MCPKMMIATMVLMALTTISCLMTKTLHKMTPLTIVVCVLFVDVTQTVLILHRPYRYSSSIIRSD